MKLFNTKNIIKLLAVLFIAITVVSCQRDGSAAEDDLPQEDLTNIILNVKDVAAGTTQTYNYSMGAGGAQAIKLTDGKTYQVTASLKTETKMPLRKLRMQKTNTF
jgi:hypothetical protein